MVGGPDFEGARAIIQNFHAIPRVLTLGEGWEFGRLAVTTLRERKR